MTGVSALKIVPYADRYADRTLAFLLQQSPEHPELGAPELLQWQRSNRYLALMGEKIVGHIAQIRQQLPGDQEIGWACTLILDTSNPLVQTFAGTRLLDAVTKESPVPFGAVGVVPEIENTHRRRGYTVHRDSCAMFARFTNPRAALRYLGKSEILAPALSLINFIRPARAESKAPPENRIETFDPAWDPIWRQHLDDRYPLYCRRNADYLNYKLRQPGKDYVIRVIENDNAPRAYIIYRLATNDVKNIRLVKVCDLVGNDRDRRRLLRTAVGFARKEQADGIVAISSVTDARLFKGSGLWVAKPYPVVLDPALDGRIHVTFFDSDLDDLW